MPISYTSSNPSVATISGNTITIVAAAASSTSITASQSGNTNFNPASSVAQDLYVKGNQTISVNIPTWSNFCFNSPPVMTITSNSSTPFEIVRESSLTWFNPLQIQGNNIVPAYWGDYVYTFRIKQAATTIYNEGLSPQYNIYMWQSPDPLSTEIYVAGSSTLCTGQSVQLSTGNGGMSSYQWIKNGVDISGANSDNYTVTSAGSYTVRASTDHGCSMTSIQPAVINFVNCSDFILYPNPANQNFSIEIPAATPSSTSVPFTIKNSMGNTVSSGYLSTPYDNPKLVESSYFPNGLYQVSLQFSSGAVVKTISISH